MSLTSSEERSTGVIVARESRVRAKPAGLTSSNTGRKLGKGPADPDPGASSHDHSGRLNGQRLKTSSTETPQTRRLTDSAVGRLLNERTYLIEFTHAEVLRIHAARVLLDLRNPWSKLLKKFERAALTILKEYPEYMGPAKPSLAPASDSSKLYAGDHFDQEQRT